MSEIGVIGQIYEDRRTKKQGKLVERDEKYKTLLLETSDGKSFNVSFGGFKSNWRSVDEHIETIEEAMEEVEIPEKPSKKVKKQVKKEEPVEEAPVKKERKKQAERNISAGYEASVHKMMEYAKSFSNPTILIDVVPEKRKIILKAGSKKVFNLNYHTRTNNFKACVQEKHITLLKDEPYVQTIKYHETWVNTRYEFTLDVDKLDEFLEFSRTYVIDSMCDRIKEEE